MLKRLLTWGFAVTLCVGFLAGCHTTPDPEFSFSNEVVPYIEETLLLNDILLVVDASGSMHFDNKFRTAKLLNQSFVAGMPEAGYLAGIISFGGDWHPNWTAHTPVCFDRKALTETAETIKWIGGSTPLYEAIAPLATAYWQLYTRSALVIFSDGKSDAQLVLQTCQNLIAAHRGTLCIHTVQIGDDEYGRNLLQSMAALTPCGTFREAASVSNKEGMEAFIRQVFFGAGSPYLDSDGDGVPDHLDRCPDTPAGVRVDQFGCWTIGETLFATDKWNLRPEGQVVMDEIAAFLKANPHIRLFVDGHTDSTASVEYNFDLSVNRAHTVFMALVDWGIHYERLVPRPFGELHPRVPNDTSANRQLNRRVELRLAN